MWDIVGIGGPSPTRTHRKIWKLVRRFQSYGPKGETRRVIFGAIWGLRQRARTPTKRKRILAKKICLERGDVDLHDGVVSFAKSCQILEIWAVQKHQKTAKKRPFWTVFGLFRPEIRSWPRGVIHIRKGHAKAHNLAFITFHQGCHSVELRAKNLTFFVSARIGGLRGVLETRFFLQFNGERNFGPGLPFHREKGARF